MFFRLITGFILFAMTTHGYATDLLEAYLLAKKQDPAYNTKLLLHQQRLQELKISRSSLLPTINAYGNRSYLDSNSKINHQASTANGNFKTTQYGINLNQSILSFKNYLQYKQYHQQILSSNKSTQAAEQDLILDLAHKYFAILASNDLLNTYNSNFSAIAKKLEQVEKKFKIGTIAVTDVLAAKARLDQINAKIILATNAVSISKQQFNQLLGTNIPFIVPLKVELNLHTPVPNNVHSWVEQARKDNLEIQAMRYKLTAAKHQHAATTAEHLPTLNLTAKIEKFIHSPPDNSNSVIRQIGINLNFPIFSGGSITAHDNIALLGVNTAMQQLELTCRNIETQTIMAFTNILTSIATIEASEQGIKSHQAALTAHQNAFAAGSRTILDVLNTEAELLQTKQELLQAKYDYILNNLKLKKSIGTLNLSDLEEVNDLLANNATMHDYTAAAKIKVINKKTN